MNDINPNNYDGTTVTVVGRAASEPRTKTFDSGNSLSELSIAVGKGYKNREGEWVDTGTDWYTLTASTDYASQNWPQVVKGSKVRIDGARLEASVFQKKDGSPGLSLNLRYGDLRVVSQPKGSDGFTPEDGDGVF